MELWRALLPALLSVMLTASSTRAAEPFRSVCFVTNWAQVRAQPVLTAQAPDNDLGTAIASIASGCRRTESAGGTSVPLALSARAISGQSSTVQAGSQADCRGSKNRRSPALATQLPL